MLTLNVIKTTPMLAKKDVLDSINSLPAEFDAEDAIERIILLEKINTGLQQSEKGEVFSIDATKDKLKKWL